MLEVRIDRKRIRAIIEKFIRGNAGRNDEMIETATRERRIGASLQCGKMIRVQSGEQIGHGVALSRRGGAIVPQIEGSFALRATRRAVEAVHTGPDRTRQAAED